MVQQLKTVYLDYAATTPVDPRVLEVMLPFFTAEFGNPSSIHRYGQKGENAVENTREILAEGLNCLPDEVIFTSCGSESDNLAVRGAAFAARQSRKANHILISPVEHHAVSITALQLAKNFGFELEYLPVDQYGMVSADDVNARLREDTAVVSVIYANNEIGTINPIAEIGEVCRKRNIPMHTDAVQAGAYLSVDTKTLNVDLLSLGAHKFYGPKGVGALYIRKGTNILPMNTGGSQEFGLRAGTHNVPYIAGMGKAFELAQEEMENRQEAVIYLRELIITKILNTVSASKLTGHPVQRLPNHSSFVFKDVDGNSLLISLDSAGFAVSSGSACKTGNPEPSDVLIAIGLEHEWALGSLRVTLGASTTRDHVDEFLDVLPGAVALNRQAITGLSREFK